MSSLFHKGIISILLSTLIVSSIVYASSTIISVQTQSIAQGDVIANGWFQEVNDRLKNIFSSGGDVGIGIMNPGQKLSVAGVIESLTGGVKFPDGTIQITAYSGANTGDGSPVGSISAFFTSTCPTGWVIADGTSGTPDLRGEFIRGLDSGRGVDSGRNLGSWQDASRVTGAGGNPTPTYLLSNWYGYCSASNNCPPMIEANLEDIATFVTGNNWLVGFSSYANTSYSSTNYGKVRPRNVALLYCMKISGASSTQSNTTTWTRIGNDVVQASTGVVQVNNGIKFPDGTIQTTADKPISVCRPTINRTMSASSSAAYQQVIFDERKLDTNSFCNTSNSRFQPTRAGYYRIDVSLGYAASTAGGGHTVYMLIARNDTTTEITSYTLHNYTSSYQNTLIGSTIVYLNGTTDYITVKAFTNNTTGTTTILNGDNTHLEAEFLRS